jgi:hypothetical protein
MVAPAYVNGRPSNLVGLPKETAQWPSKALDVVLIENVSLLRFHGSFAL